MKQPSETIVFFGSGPVAAASLRLLAKDFTIEAVITKPRPLHHHGDVPVLAVANELGLKVETAANKQELDDLFSNVVFKSRVGVLIDFGIIVSRRVIDYFPMGIVNSHFSILPEWRGADPITFAILSGQKNTGVSLMLLVEAMDEGPLLATASLELPSDVTTQELTGELIESSYYALRDTLPMYIDGSALPISQEEAARLGQRPFAPTYSRKLSKQDGLLDWSKPAVQLEREIRAFLEWPKSRTTFGNLEVVITKAHISDEMGAAGTTLVVAKQPAVHCNGQTLVIERLKPAGKQEMTGEAFLAGYKNTFLS